MAEGEKQALEAQVLDDKLAKDTLMLELTTCRDELIKLRLGTTGLQTQLQDAQADCELLRDQLSSAAMASHELTEAKVAFERACS